MNSFVRLISSSRESIKCELSHEDSPGRCTIFGVLKFDRVTADMSIQWCYECPLSLRVRLREIFKFVRLCGQL